MLQQTIFHIFIDNLKKNCDWLVPSDLIIVFIYARFLNILVSHISLSVSFMHIVCVYAYMHVFTNIHACICEQEK